MDALPLDRSSFPTLAVAEGYDQWSATYDESVLDAMDLRLLDRIKTVDWHAARRVLDLACGTGRVGAWLRARTLAPLCGVDLSRGMLDLARERSIYERLALADIRKTDHAPESFDLCVQSLADEHLDDLHPLYDEVARVATRDGVFVLIGYHPYSLLRGRITHFHSPDGQAIAIESHIHLLSDHHHAARLSGWALREIHEGLIDDDVLQIKPKWSDRRGWPFSFALVWERLG